VAGTSAPPSSEIFYLTRFVAGMGIGGQYSAINSAIDEVMPSKYRGRVDIWINGSHWAGAILGSLVSYIFLNHFAANVGCIAGAIGPAFYGALIGTGSSRTGLFVGYLIGAGIMLIGGLVEVFLGVQAAGKSLEQVTKPLTSTDQATPATQAASTAAA
jgi:MFS family permease